MRIAQMPFLLLLWVALAIVGCKQPPKPSKAEELKLRVESLHDSLMIASEDLVKLRRSLAKTMNNTESQQERMKIRGHIALINAGESFMNDWMKMYKAPEADETEEKVIEYYNYQLKELERMKEQFGDAKEKAEEFIVRYEQ